jgi:ferredoxin-type protein NapH
MTETKKAAAPRNGRLSLTRSLIATLPMMILTFMMISGGKVPSDPKRIFALAATFIFFNALFFLMLRTGKTDRYRAILFSLFAVFMTVSFISHLVEVRGSMSLSEATVLECKTPFCHIVIPMTAIPLALSGTVIFPGTMTGAFAAIASMLVIWIGASLALGRGFCSWACFFGGWDDGFSRIRKKPFIKKIDDRWHYFPYALLLVIMLGSAIVLAPVYCQWLCPFKTVTEFAEITSVKILIQTVIFVSLFIGLVIVLPILTGRRTQCGLFCPFGAFQSVTNKISPFEVSINKDTCVKCGRCEKVCPTFSMNKESIEAGKPRLSCSKCGKCIDNCPTKSLAFHVKGTAPAGNAVLSRLLFLYPAFLFLATMSNHEIQDVLLRMIQLVTTGSLFLS